MISDIKKSRTVRFGAAKILTGAVGLITLAATNFP